MNFPAPSEKQARILWFALTGLAVGILLALVGVLVWGFGWILSTLSSVLLPLAVAGILAYLLDPVVDYLESIRIPRGWAILLVFMIAVAVLAIIVTAIVPRLIGETRDLVEQVPTYREKLELRVNNWLQANQEWLKGNAKWVTKAREAWEGDLGQKAQVWLAGRVPAVSNWMLAQLGRVASWAGLSIGFALVPVYTFYFLLEKKGISGRWQNYMPIHESRLKDELVFVIQAINDYLILFFRGQVLVALCDGVLLTIGFFAIGLNYAFLLGFVAGILSIVPFLGVVVSIIPALILASVQYTDWLHPLLVVGIFALVQFLEGFFISPKIMGDRVGLHPLTIIIAVMIGTTLMGGIIGGILAIPLTAALRVVMFRYVWKQPELSLPASSEGKPKRREKK